MTEHEVHLISKAINTAVYRMHVAPNQRADARQQAWLRVLWPRFNPALGIPLSVFARRRAIWALQDWFRSQDLLIRRDRKMVQRGEQEPVIEEPLTSHALTCTQPNPEQHYARKEVLDRMQQRFPLAFALSIDTQSYERHGLNRNQACWIRKAAIDKLRETERFATL